MDIKAKKRLSDYIFLCLRLKDNDNRYQGELFRIAREYFDFSIDYPASFINDYLLDKANNLLVEE